ncbi:hypothetical protein GVX82_02885 [Patescibacteria group bacterium]|jgi:hypothetical protein|nr:hypothetical protein [Patescibacteria group bacterium]
MAHLPNKTLYFIRHGETLYNRRWRHQHAQVPLSERGRAQAAALARRFARGSDPLSPHCEGDYGRLRTTWMGFDGLLYLTTSNTDEQGVPRE